VAVELAVLRSQLMKATASRRPQTARIKARLLIVLSPLGLQEPNAA
jgi:hypothetical protein